MKRRQFSSAFKVKVVLEVLREERTLSEIAAEHDLNPNQLANWRREFLEKAPEVFGDQKTIRDKKLAERRTEEEKSAMLKTIGQLTMERDFLKDVHAKLSDRGLL
jgi:transposase-like protein